MTLDLNNDASIYNIYRGIITHRSSHSIASLNVELNHTFCSLPLEATQTIISLLEWSSRSTRSVIHG